MGNDFFQNNPPGSFCCFWKKTFSFIFLKVTRFCSFVTKTGIPHSELFYCIMQYPYFQNNIKLVMPIMAFKIEGKEIHPIFVFAKCCWSVHSAVVRLGKHAHSKQRKTIPTQTVQFHFKFMCMPGQFSIYIVHFFNIWFGMVQNQRKLRCREGRKIG